MRLQFSARQSCVNFVMGRTTMTINDGFVLDPTLDAVYNKLYVPPVLPILPMPSIRVVQEGYTAYPVAHANGLDCPGSIKSMDVYENAQLIWTSQAQTRCLLMSHPV